MRHLISANKTSKCEYYEDNFSLIMLLKLSFFLEIMLYLKFNQLLCNLECHNNGSAGPVIQGGGHASKEPTVGFEVSINCIKLHSLQTMQINLSIFYLFNLIHSKK